MKKFKFKYFICLFTFVIFLTIQNVNAVELENIPLELEITNEQNMAETDRFTFEMVAEDENTPMPEGSVNNKCEIVVNGSGIFNLAPITYDVPGIYKYSVYQVKGNNPLCTYDDSKYTVIVSVEDSLDYTELIVHVEISKEGEEEKQDSVYFKNEYKDMINLPDTSDINIYGYMIIITILTALTVLTIRKKVLNK